MKVAAVIMKRKPRIVYEWLEDHRLAFRCNTDGVLEVLSKTIVRVEAGVRSGQPKGVPTRRH